LKRQFWLNETLFPGREFAKHSEPASNTRQTAISFLLIGFYPSNPRLI